MAEIIDIDPKGTLKRAAEEVESLKKEYGEAGNKFRRAIIRFTQLRFKTVRYFKFERFNPETQKMDFSMYIKVRACDEKELNIDFVRWTPYGRDIGEDTIMAEDPQIAGWLGINEEDYNKAEAMVYEKLNVQKTGGIILAR